jgi:hypothetical protein
VVPVPIHRRRLCACGGDGVVAVVVVVVEPVVWLISMLFVPWSRC